MVLSKGEILNGMQSFPLKTKWCSTLWNVAVLYIMECGYVLWHLK